MKNVTAENKSHDVSQL